MPKLILKKKAEVLGEFALEGASCTVGSEPANDVVIADKMVSMTHFRLERRGRRYLAHDLKSAFGTFVNGVKITEPTTIHDGDTITVGEHTLVFRASTETSSQPPELDNHANAGGAKDFWGDVKEAVINVAHGETENPGTGREGKPREHFEFELSEPSDVERLNRLKDSSSKADDSLESELAEVLEQVATAGPEHSTPSMEKSPYYLLAIYGPYLGKKYQLNFGEIKIGREVRLNDIVIRENRKGEIDPSISRRHATISHRNNAFYLSDKRSKSRTYLNGDRLSESDELLMTPGDEIEIVSDQQSTIFRFVAEGNWDFSFPRRTGVWWLRYRSLALHLGAAAVTLACLIVGGAAWYQRTIATDVPNPLKLDYHQVAKFADTSQTQFSEETLPAGGPLPPLPVLADVNGDDYVDLMVLQSNGTLTAHSIKGRRRLWKINTVILDQNCPPAVADLNGNGLPDLVALTADAHLVAIDGLHGAEIWTSPLLSKEINGPPVTGDFDGDGRTDVAAISAEGRLEVGYGRVYEMEWVEVDVGLASRAPLSCADLDGDGDVEILLGTEMGLILIYDGVERRLASSVNMNLSLNKLKGSFVEDNPIRHPVSAADMNGDGKLDLVVSSRKGNLVCVDISSQTPEGKIKVRELWWASLTRGDSIPDDFSFPFVLGDIDGDQLPDVVAVSENGTIAGFRGLGRDGQKQPELWHTEGGILVNHPSLFDVDHDGRGDVVAAEKLGLIKILSGKTGEALWQARQEEIIGPTETPLLADLSDDSDLDLVLLGINSVVHMYKTNRLLPGAFIAWGQRFGNSSNLSTLAVPRFAVGLYHTMLVASVMGIIVVNAANWLVRRRRRRFGSR